MNPTGANQQLTVSIVTNQQSAQQTQQALDKHDQSIRQILRTYRDWEMAARKMTAVGRDLAIAGAAILAPLIASANEYSKRFGQLETQSRNFLAAQQRQADATANLGRVAAQTLTPLMNQVADFTDKVAAFAAAHPELMQTAVGLGAGLAAGGGALVAAGMAISTIAKSAELLKAALSVTGTSGIAGSAVTATVSLIALAAGAKLGEAAVNKLGEATGDERLAHYQLSDALKTARQVLGTVVLALAEGFVEAKKSLSDAWATLLGVFSDFGTKIEDAIDSLATGFRKVFTSIQGLFADVYNNTIGQLPGQSKMAGSSAQADSINSAEDTLFNLRSTHRLAENSLYKLSISLYPDQQYEADKANLNKLAEFVAHFANTGSLGGGVDSFLGGIGKSIGSFFSATPKASGVSGSGLPPEAVNAYMDYQKSLLQAEQQYVVDAKALKDNYNASELKAEEDHQASMQRAQESFDFNEKQVAAKIAFDKLQKQQQLQTQLDQLSGARDVQGFINAQANAKLQQDQQDKQDDFAKQQRAEAFTEQQKQNAQQFTQEKRDRATALQDQLSQLKQKHIQEDNLLEQHFAEQLAALSQNVAGLNGIQSAYYTKATADAQAFVATNQAILQGLYRSTLTGPSGSSGVISNPGAYSPLPPVTGTAGNNLPGAGITIGSFASGIARIPRDMLIVAHEGERITRAVDNHPAGNTYQIAVYNTVGDIATKSMLDSAVDDIATGIRKAVYAQ